MTTNEAAERLRDFVRAYVRSDARLALIDEALAAERRATVERIREALDARTHSPVGLNDAVWRGNVHAILDEEAAR